MKIRAFLKLIGRVLPAVTGLLLAAVLAAGSAGQAQVHIFPGGLPPGVVFPGNNNGGQSSGSDNGQKNSGGGPWVPSQALTADGTSTNADGSKTNVDDTIQVSFQGANVDMVAQWLMQTTGKTVIKH